MRQMVVHREYISNNIDILKAFINKKPLVHLIYERDNIGRKTGTVKEVSVTDSIDLTDLENYRIE